MDITENFHFPLKNSKPNESEDTRQVPFLLRINEEINNFFYNFEITTNYNQLMKLSIKFNTFSIETRQLLQTIKPKTTQADFFEGVKIILQKRIAKLNLKFEEARASHYKNLPKMNIEDLQTIQVEDKESLKMLKKFSKKAHEYLKIDKKLQSISKTQKFMHSVLLNQRENIFEIIEKKKNIQATISDTSVEVKKGKEERSFLMRFLRVHIFCCSFVLLFINFF